MTAKLDGARAIELSMAAEVGHSGLEGKTGAGGDLLEDHAKALVAEQVRIITVNLNGLLHCKTKILDSQNLLFGELIRQCHVDFLSAGLADYCYETFVHHASC